MEICSERLYNPWEAELSAEVSCINKSTCYLSHFMAVSMYIKKSGINTFNAPTNVNISGCNAWRNFWHFLLFQLEERKLNQVLKTNNIIISSFAALCAGFRLSRLPGDNKIMLISSSQSPITENSLGWHMTCCELVLTYMWTQAKHTGYLDVSSGKFFPSPLLPGAGIAPTATPGGVAPMDPGCGELGRCWTVKKMWKITE